LSGISESTTDIAIVLFVVLAAAFVVLCVIMIVLSGKDDRKVTQPISKSSMFHLLHRVDLERSENPNRQS
jgi:hypothetical protein